MVVLCMGFASKVAVCRGHGLDDQLWQCNLCATDTCTCSDGWCSDGWCVHMVSSQLMTRDMLLLDGEVNILSFVLGSYFRGQFINSSTTECKRASPPLELSRRPGHV